MAFQKKHWFDSRITRRYLLDLKARYPGQLIGLIWDSAPSHKDTASIEFLKQAEDDGWLKVVRIPGGITSVVQVGDIACNGPLKKRVKALYGKWRSAQIREIQEKNNSRYTGNEKLVVSRDRIIEWVERAIREYNSDQMQDNTIVKTFRLVGQDPFNDSTQQFEEHLRSLRETGAYNALTLRHEEVERQKNFEESAETILLKLQDLTLDSMRAEEIGVALEYGFFPTKLHLRGSYRSG